MPDLFLYLTTFLVIGAVAGTLAGLLGVGGGLVVVPALTLVLGLQGFPNEILVHTAVGTSLATILVTSLASARAHQKLQGMDWDRVRRLAPGVAVGALLGSFLALFLPGDALRVCVGLFELWVAVRWGFRPPSTIKPATAESSGSTVIATGIGALSALVGIGGGTLTVPYMVRIGATIHQAVAVAAACGLPIALAGTIGFIVTGWGNPHLTAGGLGFVFIPAWIVIGVASVLFAPMGARLSNRLSGTTLRRWFSVFLAAAGVMMLAG